MHKSVTGFPFSISENYLYADSYLKFEQETTYLSEHERKIFFSILWPLSGKLNFSTSDYFLVLNSCSHAKVNTYLKKFFHFSILKDITISFDHTRILATSKKKSYKSAVVPG